LTADSATKPAPKVVRFPNAGSQGARSRAEAKARIEDGAPDFFNLKTGIPGEISKFAGRSEAAMAPKARAQPSANATAGCPRAPLAKFADNQTSFRRQHACNLSKGRRRVVDETENRNRCYDIKVIRRERQTLGLGYLKGYIRPSLLRPLPGCFDHRDRRIDPGHDRSARCEFACQLSIAASDVKNLAALDLAEHIEN